MTTLRVRQRRPRTGAVTARASRPSGGRGLRPGYTGSSFCTTGLANTQWYLHSQARHHGTRFKRILLSQAPACRICRVSHQALCISAEHHDRPAVGRTHAIYMIYTIYSRQCQGGRPLRTNALSQSTHTNIAGAITGNTWSAERLQACRGSVAVAGRVWPRVLIAGAHGTRPKRRNGTRRCGWRSASVTLVAPARSAAAAASCALLPPPTTRTRLLRSSAPSSLRCDECSTSPACGHPSLPLKRQRRRCFPGGTGPEQ